MCYIDDFIDGCFQSIIRNKKSLVYNLGNPFNTMTINRIAQTVLSVTQSSGGIKYISKEYPDKKGVTPNIERAEKELDFNPKTSLEEGLKQMVVTQS